jgi:hypothetical protein
MYDVFLGTWMSSRQSPFCRRGAWHDLLMPRVAGLVFAGSSVKAVLQLPLFPGLPWDEPAVQIDTTATSSTRRTSNCFEFQLVDWDDFAPAVSKWWEGEDAKKLFSNGKLQQLQQWQTVLVGAKRRQPHMG